MFTNISWGNYIVVVILLLASWYIFVGVRFYFDDLKDILNGKRKLQFRGFENPNYKESQSELNHQESPETISNQSDFIEFDSTFEDVDALVAHLKNIIEDAAKRKLLKEEFLQYIRMLLKEYPTVKDSAFRTSVSQLIVTECKTLVPISVTQAEAEGLWN